MSSKKNDGSRSKWLKTVLPLMLIMIFTIFSVVNPVFSADISGSKITFQPDDEPVHPVDIYLIGQDVYYNLEVENTDDEEDSIVEIRDTDPSGVEWWYDFESGEWVLDRPDEDTTIAPGETWEGTFVYTVEEDALFEGEDGRNRIRNAFTAIGTQGEEEIDVRVTKTSFVVQPEITVEKSVSHDTSKVGDTVTYTIEITNTGDWALEDVTVVDSLLGDISDVFTDTLGVGESDSEEFVFEIPDQEGALNLVNEVEVSGTAEGFDPEIEGAVVTAEDEVEVELVYPEISIEKEVDREVPAKEGSILNYTVTVSNTGDVDMEVVVDDTLVEEELFDGIIDAGDDEEFNYSYTVTEDDVAAGSVTNTATAIATLEWLELDNEYEVEATVEVQIVTPEIQITKTADPTEGYVGDEITYTICIENIGDYDLENIVVNDSMLGGDLEGFPITLAEGSDPVSVDFEYTISEGDLPGPIENTAEVSANPVGMENDITDDDDAVVNVLVEDLLVIKTAETSFNRTHEWDIDKEVTTEYGHTIGGEEDPKIWLYEDGSGNETATWVVCVTYEGFEDSEYNVSGEISIENTGNAPAVITEIEDLLGGEDISDNIVWDWPEGSEFPYTLSAEETLTGTYDEDGHFEGENIVTVTTDREEYEAEANIVWDEPDEESYTIVNITDDSEFLTDPSLGNLNAANLDEGETSCFDYEHFFAWADYEAPGPYIYDNTATIVETGQNASATLIINWEPPDEVCWGDDTAWAYGDEYAEPNWDYVNNRNWGWTNGPLEEGSYEWEIYAGAGQNILENGYVVGTLYVKYEDGCVSVTYEMDEGYYLGEMHLWVGDGDRPYLPTVSRGRNDVYTNAPGQFPYGTNYGFDPDDLDTWKIDWNFEKSDFEGDVYVAAHAVVWMEVECE